jgi:hypothetical protein
VAWRPAPASPAAQEEGEADETDDLVNQVLDEIGINMTSQVRGWGGLGGREGWPGGRGWAMWRVKEGGRERVRMGVWQAAGCRLQGLEAAGAGRA